MRSLIQIIFNAFGAHPLARILASTIIGAVLIAFSIGKRGGPEVGTWSGWLIFGALTGGLAGLLLSWPRAFPGTMLTLLGAVVVWVPMSNGDGSPVPMQEYFIKAVIGLGIICLGLLLLFRARIHKIRRELDTNNSQNNGFLD